MTTYILLNTISVGMNQYKSGSTIDTTCDDATAIQAGGGVLVPTTVTGIAAAGATVLGMWVSGKTAEECDVAMMAAYLGLRAAVSTSVSHCGFCRYTAPITAEVISVYADTAMGNGVKTVVAQPDYPRKLQIGITDTDASVSAGTLTIVGVAADGTAITDVVALTGGTAVKTTTYAYARITSMTVALLAGNTGADKVSVGLATGLGLPIPAAATSIVVRKAVESNVDVVVGTVDTTARSIVPTNLPNATRNYDFWYSYSLSHLHVLV